MRRVAKQWRTEVYGAVSTFTYDAKDRLTQDATSAPLAHTYTYTYDSRDNILTNSESGGVVQMNYDAASRLTTSTSGGVTTTYTFDSNGNFTGVNSAGPTGNTVSRATPWQYAEQYDHTWHVFTKLNQRTSRANPAS